MLKFLGCIMENYMNYNESCHELSWYHNRFMQLLKKLFWM